MKHPPHRSPPEVDAPVISRPRIEASPGFMLAGGLLFLLLFCIAVSYLVFLLLPPV